MLINKKYVPVFSLILAISTAAASPILQTQTEMKQLDAQISVLQQTLLTANDKRTGLNKALSGTEKQIGEGVNALKHLQQGVVQTERNIQNLQSQVDALTGKLRRQQQHLANHLRTRYQMGDYQPLKWLLNQENPYALSRILTYYQYLIQSRQRLIDEIDATRKNLHEKNQNLVHELAQNQHLHQRLLQHQQSLEAHKNDQKSLLTALNNEIQSKENALLEVRRNKSNLTRLLKRLTEQSIAQPSTPFFAMRKKLPFPVHTDGRSMQSMKQGVTFFADEGTSVRAIYPGKIVFSDWLKGYGLLLIIDHGQGYMTLYAHNQSLFKRKGQFVTQNEQIASVGHSGGIQQNGLYFEVRHKGKAVPPLGWLA